ncbi:MAG: hypothetical protein Q9M36_03985 [Sulfurovum sp.]|nr:hypothetical protein [Sulfurovum sp.]
MLKIVFFILTLLLIVGLFIKSMLTDTPNIQINHQQTIVQKARESSYQSMPPLHVARHTDTVAVSTKGLVKKVYRTLSIEEASLSIKARPSITPIMAIELHKQAYHVGDRLILPDIQGLDYKLTVTHVQTHSNHSVSISARYHDEGIPYSTTMTQSPSQSFASVSTAQGMYEIETQNGIGYIYRTQDIRQHLQPNPIDDVIILPLP